MGMLIERDLEGELMSKIKVIIEKALESVNKDYPTPLFDFEKIVDGLDENDPFMKDIFTFLVKDVAQRHRDTLASDEILRPPTIHHSFSQPISSPPASSSTAPTSSSDTLSTSISSLVFNSRILRHNQLFRTLLNDEDSTETGLSSESVRRPIPWFSNTANSTSSPTDLAERAPPVLGRVLSSQDQASEDDSDSEDDFPFFRLRRETRSLNPATPGSNQSYESNQRYYSPFRSALPFYSSAVSSWGGRHPMMRHLGQNEENTEQSNENLNTDARRNILLRHLQARSQSQSRRRDLQRQQPQQQSEQPALALTTLSIDSGPTSFPSGSLVPNSDSDLGILRSSTAQSLDISHNLNPTQEVQEVQEVQEAQEAQGVQEATLNLGEAPMETSMAVQTDTPSEIPNNQTLTDNILVDQSQPILSHPPFEEYNEFAEESRRSRAAFRSGILEHELRSMRRRTLDVVDRFAGILDNSEEEETLTHNTTTSRLDNQQSEPAQQMGVATGETENIQTLLEESSTRDYAAMRGSRNVG